MKHGAIIRLIGLTMLIAVVLMFLSAVIVSEQVGLMLFFPVWVGLFFGWPYLSRKLGFPNFPSAPAPRKQRLSGPKRPLWLRLIRGTLVWVGGIVLAIVLMSMIVIVPISLCHHRAQKVHDSIHVGMTVPEVLHVVTDCDIFQASSDFPYDENAHGDDIPAMNLGR